MKNLLKTIDGTKSKGKAPRPSRGLQLAVYETINACGGANYAQIKKYLPAAITDAKQVATKKQIDHAISNGIYRGYFIERNNHYYVAPVEIWEIRQDYMKRVKGSHGPRTGSPGTTRPNEPEFVITRPRPLWHWSLILGTGAAWFVAGLAVGYALGGAA